MKVTVTMSFKIEGSDRIHHLSFPAVLTTDDNCLETKDMKLEAVTFEGISVDCSFGIIRNGIPFPVIRNDPSV